MIQHIINKHITLRKYKYIPQLNLHKVSIFDVILVKL